MQLLKMSQPVSWLREAYLGPRRRSGNFGSKKPTKQTGTQIATAMKSDSEIAAKDALLGKSCHKRFDDSGIKASEQEEELPETT